MWGLFWSTGIPPWQGVIWVNWRAWPERYIGLCGPYQQWEAMPQGLGNKKDRGGSFLKAFFGYKGNPELIEALAYLVTALAYLFRVPRLAEKRVREKRPKLSSHSSGVCCEACIAHHPSLLRQFPSFLVGLGSGTCPAMDRAGGSGVVGACPYQLFCQLGLGGVRGEYTPLPLFRGQPRPSHGLAGPTDEHFPGYGSVLLPKPLDKPEARC